MAEPLKIAIAGALGRMGQAVGRVVEAAPGCVIAALFDAPGREGEVVDGEAGRGRVLVTRDQALDMGEVVIDFTVPTATTALVRRAAERGGPALVLGATGLSADDMAVIGEASARTAIVQSGNYSLGVNVLTGLVRQAAERLDAVDWDIEIFEAHHRRKVDAPSGSALMLGRAAAAGRDVDLEQVADRGRDGITGPRQVGHIGFSVMRGGGIVGEHQVVFAAEDEILTLGHSGRDRSLFARGALQAALWVADKPPGLYDMMDVLGFKA